jgi:hypothetical protein
VVEETDQIKQHIDKEREILGRNLDEIEFRVKDATDVKAIFNRNTGWILGAAVAGGFLLSLSFGKSSATATNTTWKSDARERDIRKAVPSTRAVSTHLNRVSETVDNIFAGLVGVFSDRLQSFVADAVPGFREQYNRIDQRDHSPVQPMRSTVEG